MNLLVFLTFIHFSIYNICGVRVKVTFNGSTILGLKQYTVFGKNPYIALWKIPYAKPPVGNLRFKPPIQERLWLSQTCYDHSVEYNDTCSTKPDEDCLYLSLYIPKTKKNTYYPVLVWIHEESSAHGPDFFIDEEILVVTVSYRTGIFGFLNTGDDFANGNMGAKDLVMALKWIKDNIKFLNGDPNKVTIASSGVSANLLAAFVLSPITEGLFTKAIIQGGSAMTPANFRSYQFEIANKLYWNLGGPFDKFNRKELYNFLLTSPTNVILKSSNNLFDSSEVRDSQRLINSFGPSVEVSNKHAFMNKSPIDVYNRRMAINNIDLMMGYTSLDSFHKLKGLNENKNLLKYLNYNFQYLLPFEGTPDEFGSKKYKIISKKIKDFYFLNGTITVRSLRRYAKYLSDQIIYPLIRQARLHAEGSCNEVYLYRFSFRGSLNVYWHSSLSNLNVSGATGSDEICYLFKCKSENNIYKNLKQNEKLFIKKISRLWGNFVKFGNPTPRKSDYVLEDIFWNALTSKGPIKGLNINSKQKMICVPEEKRVKFWDKLMDEFFHKEMQ